MVIDELIKKLSAMPQDAEVFMEVEGGYSTSIKVSLDACGDVLLETERGE